MRRNSSLCVDMSLECYFRNHLKNFLKRVSRVVLFIYIFALTRVSSVEGETKALRLPLLWDNRTSSGQRMQVFVLARKLIFRGFLALWDKRDKDFPKLFTKGDFVIYIEILVIVVLVFTESN